MCPIRCLFECGTDETFVVCSQFAAAVTGFKVHSQTEQFAVGNRYRNENGNRSIAAKSPSPAPSPSSGGCPAGELAVRDQTEGPGQYQYLLRDGAKRSSSTYGIQVLLTDDLSGLNN